MVSSPAPSWSDYSDSDMDDLITPCSSEKDIVETTTAAKTTMNTCQQRQTAAAPRFTAPHSRSSSPGARRCSTDASVDLHSLWMAMLSLQQRYDCYRSVRVRIAADIDTEEEASDLMPSRACIDSLNDSIESLPEEGWKILEPYLGPFEEGRTDNSRDYRY